MEPTTPQETPAKTPAEAIVSLILGIFAVLTCGMLFIPQLLAVIFGHVARGKAKKLGIENGKTMALIGLIMGYLMFIALPVSVGLGAAMAIPAFQKVRIHSQNPAVVNNMRQIAAAAEQYYVANNVSTVDLEDLIGESNYIMGTDESSLQVANEDYPDTITEGQNIIVTNLPYGAGGAGVDDFTPTSGSTTLEMEF